VPFLDRSPLGRPSIASVVVPINPGVDETQPIVQKYGDNGNPDVECLTVGDLHLPGTMMGMRMASTSSLKASVRCFRIRYSFPIKLVLRIHRVPDVYRDL
jgi:hypothetical protein